MKRLNIPDKIPKKLAHSASCLEWFDGKILTLSNANESNVRYYCENRTYNSIIPPEWLEEIKPLSVDEIMLAVTNNDQHNQKSYRLLMRECVELGLKNGMLKRDLELRPIIEYCKKQVELNRHPYWQDLIGLIENIKPLDE